MQRMPSQKDKPKYSQQQMPTQKDNPKVSNTRTTLTFKKKHWYPCICYHHSPAQVQAAYLGRDQMNPNDLAAISVFRCVLRGVLAASPPCSRTW